MTGATGYIGKHLSAYLSEKGGHQIIPLGRSMFREGMSGRLSQTLANCEVVINLAGAPINKCWTAAYKRQLFESRIGVTNRLNRALSSLTRKPKLLISASAVGIIQPLARWMNIRKPVGKAFYPIFVMPGKRKPNAVRPLHGLLLPALG
ncbi:cell division inhibitor [Bacteroides reticulotermitis JCM 10512]|uniref:Cell division inhibitor n=1 Tax=Bacteroides reticulotermitis JCM 10512 TaxID=1445607 RepID=W4UWG6_9BACE|nr:cell division inhibitor [Bacteroides reticulotermitis JCM 10512]